MALAVSDLSPRPRTRSRPLRRSVNAPRRFGRMDERRSPRSLIPPRALLYVEEEGIGLASRATEFPMLAATWPHLAASWKPMKRVLSRSREKERKEAREREGEWWKREIK